MQELMDDEIELESELETAEGYSDKIISMKSKLTYDIMKAEPESFTKKTNSFN